MADSNAANKKKGGLIQYFKDCKTELKKVTWPTKEQLIHNTGVIIAFIIIVTIIGKTRIGVHLKGHTLAERLGYIFI